MTRVGVTGHQEIPEGVLDYVVDNVSALLASCSPPVSALTSLAAGADQLVAREVLTAGGTLHVVVPSRGYETTLARDDLRSYEALVSQAQEVTLLDFPEPSEEAYWAAGRAIVDGCDLLLAIWDGQPARGLGGTADVVAYARDLEKEVRVVWPQGVGR